MLFWSSINFPNTARLRNVEMFIIGNFFNEDVKQKKWDKNDFFGENETGMKQPYKYD